MASFCLVASFQEESSDERNLLLLSEDQEDKEAEDGFAFGFDLG